MKGIRIYTDQGEYDYAISNNTTQRMAEQMFLRIHKDEKVIRSMLMPRCDVRINGRIIT